MLLPLIAPEKIVLFFFFKFKFRSEIIGVIFMVTTYTISVLGICTKGYIYYFKKIHKNMCILI